MGGAASGLDFSAMMGNSTQASTVGNQGGQWSHSDFVKHYFSGDGETVNLGDVGLGKPFENTDSVTSETERLMSEVLSVAKDGYSALGRGDTNVTFEPDLYSVGNSTLFMDAACGGGSCTFDFKIRDWFRDPLDIGMELPGGQPYRINHDWQVERGF
jgi:hypothetical protein